MRIHRAVLSLVGLVLLAACASAEKRFEQGVELEERGRPADAAARYIDALRRDPSLAEARGRLQDAGDRAAADYLAQSEAAAAGGRPGEAADVLLRLDALRRDAAGVGVSLNVGADYEARRRQTFDRAIADAIAGSREALRAREWGSASSLLDRAADRWQPTAAQRAELDRTRFDAHLGWAEWELQQGRFRAAHERAAGALALAGRGTPEAGRALDVQAEALRRGTVRVAVLPVMATEEARRRLPTDLLTELNDELALTHWSRAPLFVDVVDPQAVAREARREGLTRRGVSTRDASLLGQRVGAEVVVVAEVDSVRTDTADLRVSRRTARTRTGADTAYSVHEGRLQTRTHVTLALIDVGTRRVLQTDRVSAGGGARFRHASFAGDWRTLNLTREERDLFDARREDEMQNEVVRDLVRGLSERLARSVYDSVLRDLR